MTTNFETPQMAGDIIDLLNKTQKYKLTLSYPDGAVTGLLPTDHPVVMENAEGNSYSLVNGDALEDAKALFITQDPQAALAFLQGFYLGMFGDVRLENVQDELTELTQMFVAEPA
jgi:hypothetical protein